MKFLLFLFTYFIGKETKKIYLWIMYVQKKSILRWELLCVYFLLHTSTQRTNEKEFFYFPFCLLSEIINLKFLSSFWHVESIFSALQIYINNFFFSGCPTVWETRHTFRNKAKYDFIIDEANRIVELYSTHLLLLVLFVKTMLPYLCMWLSQGHCVLYSFSSPIYMFHFSCVWTWTLLLLLRFKIHLCESRLKVKEHKKWICNALLFVAWNPLPFSADLNQIHKVENIVTVSLYFYFFFWFSFFLS